MAEMSKVEAKFLTEMIDHHQAAITMSKKFLADTTPSTRLAKVADLARAIIAAQTGEIADMRGWLKTAGYDSRGSGSGHGGGM